MALTPSKMVTLGSSAPSFSLLDVMTKETVALDSMDTSKGLLVAFICNHCPYVKHLHPAFARVLNEAHANGLAVVAISSNDVKDYPEDSPEKMAELARSEGFEFPYLYDESQEVAKAYEATCTPDFFLYDSKLACVYRGAFDETRPGDGVASGAFLKQAIENVLAGSVPPKEQTPSMGCNIKWKS